MQRIGKEYSKNTFPIISKTIVSHIDKWIFLGDELLCRFMHSMTIIRNLCAHGSRLYNRLFEQKPSLSKNEKQLLIIQEDGMIDNAHLYGFVIIMKRLLDPAVFVLMKSEIV